MPSWHWSRIRREPVAPASAFATSVLPTPASPSSSSGCSSVAAEEDGDREALVGEVALAGQGLLDGCGAVEAQTLTASSSALRVSTRARWRL